MLTGLAKKFIVKNVTRNSKSHQINLQKREVISDKGQYMPVCAVAVCTQQCKQRVDIKKLDKQHIHNKKKLKREL